MKKTVLLTVNLLVEVPAEDVACGEHNSPLDKLEFKIIGLLEDIPTSLPLTWVSSQTLILDPEQMNCGRCCNCGQWMTNRDLPKPVKGLCNGTIFEGQLLCDECLPSDHRWAF